MIDIIILSVYTAAILAVGILAFSYYKRYHRVLSVVAGLVVDKEQLLDRIDELTLLASKDVNNDFIKFISESRASAFGYIETVQAAISSYKAAIESGSEDDIIVSRLALFEVLPSQKDI